jgi:hypothetical protein
MKLSTLAFATLALGVAFAPAQAQRKYACNNADIMKMEANLAKMDANKKDGMSQEIVAARAMMAKQDEAGCLTHMDNAFKMMPN